MKTTAIQAKSVLTKTSGHIAKVFTHSLNPYRGCGFGCTYCYAQFQPSWTFREGDATWGDEVDFKENAPEVLRQQLSKMKPETLREMKVFMATATDPYQPLEAREQITRRLLEVFLDFPTVGLLVQTRSPLAIRDFSLMTRHPRLVLSMTVETDLREEMLKAHSYHASPGKRLEALTIASGLGIHTQVAVSPILPYSTGFIDRLFETNPDAIIVDDFISGDGSRGRRTSQTSYAAEHPEEFLNAERLGRTFQSELEQELRHRDENSISVYHGSFGRVLASLPIPDGTQPRLF
ncbi:MAG: hypothetical protein RLP44_09550 [Aggregatilineales bacterium]